MIRPFPSSEELEPAVQLTTLLTTTEEMETLHKLYGLLSNKLTFPLFRGTLTS